MKKQENHFVFYLAFVILSAAFILSGCATAEQKQASPYVSPLQDILYGKSLGFKESGPTRDTEALGNTRWRMRSMRPSIESPFKSTEFSFERSGILVESGELPNGTIYTDTHRYRVAGSTLVITKGGRTSVAVFRVEGDTLTIDGDDYSLVLERFAR